MERGEADIEFFVDRSLGKSIVTALREAGFAARSMAEIYGEQEAQRLPDEVWLRDAGDKGWVVLTKDDAIRRRPAERDALIAAGARVFCLTAGQLRGAEQIQRFVANRERIFRQARNHGPFIYGVYASGVRRLWPEN
jgi:PIN like domain